MSSQHPSGSTAVNSSLQSILDAAEALIEEKGCRHTTLQHIIQRTGLSKGAIYHYVASKDELFAMLLQSRMEETNVRFNEVVSDPGTQGLESPLKLIAERMISSANEKSVTNTIFIYLLSQMDNPKVAEMMQQLYQMTLQMCVKWIEIGKQHHVIPAHIDAEQAADTLITLTYGLRVQSTMLQQSPRMSLEELVGFMAGKLQ